MPKFTDLDSINFLIAASNVFSCTEAARSFSSVTNAPSYDYFTRFLRKQHLDPGSLWAEVRKSVTPKGGYLIVDDTTLDKPYSKKIGFVRYQWSEKHGRVHELLINSEKASISPVFEENIERFSRLRFSITHTHYRKHHCTVKRIGLITLTWIDGKNILLVDFRIYDIDEDEKSKNDHFF